MGWLSASRHGQGYAFDGAGGKGMALCRRVGDEITHIDPEMGIDQARREDGFANKVGTLSRRTIYCCGGGARHEKAGPIASRPFGTLARPAVKTCPKLDQFAR